MSLFDVINLIFLYDNDLFYEDVNLCFFEGEYVVLVGKNGVGKFILLKILSKNFLLDKGEVFWLSG